MKTSLEAKIEQGKKNLAAARERGLNTRAGKPNKATANIKSMIEQSLDELGGVKYFKQQAIDNPQSYMQLIGKILPKNMTLDVDLNANVAQKVTFEVIHADATKRLKDVD